MTDIEVRKLEVDIAETMANTMRLGAETAKLNKESAKLNKETFWYPMALATGLVLSIGAVMKFIL